MVHVFTHYSGVVSLLIVDTLIKFNQKIFYYLYFFLTCMNAVYDSIIENLRGIKIVMEPTPASFKSDKIQTGNGREFTLSQFIEKYFPTTYAIKKAPIHSLDDRSQEIDCVILSPNHPRLYTPIREIILAEGVFAAIELKPDISILSDNKCEFKRALEQVKSVKRLKRELPFLEFKLDYPNSKPDYFKKIPTFIFAFKSKAGSETIEFMLDQIKLGNIEIYDLPDFIVTLDNGIIFFTPYSSFSLFSPLTTIGIKLPEKCFIHFRTKDENTLAFFLLNLLSVQPPSRQQFSNNMLIPYFLDSLNKINIIIHEVYFVDH